MNLISSEIIEKTMDRLKKNGMEAFYYSTREPAKEAILQRIPPGAVIGLGGSMTTREMGLLDALVEKGHVVYDHWKQGLSPTERIEVGRRQQRSDIFLTGTNALTIDGKLINTDATGNRVTSMIFGPPKVIVVTGINKIVQTLEEGLERVKQVAAPPNCQRRKDPTPCAVDLICRDCDSPARLCRVTTIIERRPFGIKEFTVFLIGENLGY
jgi:L-lactate utilization protein LutB